MYRNKLVFKFRYFFRHVLRYYNNMVQPLYLRMPLLADNVQRKYPLLFSYIPQIRPNSNVVISPLYYTLNFNYLNTIYMPCIYGYIIF